MTSLGRWVTYMMPSTTTGFDCQAPRTWLCRTHLDSRFVTLAGVICVSALYRWLSYVPLYVSQFSGSDEARRMRSNVTCCASRGDPRSARIPKTKALRFMADL